MPLSLSLSSSAQPTRPTCLSPSPPPSRAGRDPGAATAVGHPNGMAALAPCPAATALPASPVSTRASSPFSTASYGQTECASTDASSRLHRGSETPDVPVGHREAAGPIPPSDDHDDHTDHDHVDHDSDEDTGSTASDDASRTSSRLAAPARSPTITSPSLSALPSITDATDPQYWQRDGRRVRQDLAAAEAMVDWVRNESDRAKAKLADARAEIAAMQAQIDALGADVQDRVAECHAARAEVAHCSAERDSAVAECMRLAAECRVLRAERHQILVERDRWGHHQHQSTVLVADRDAAKNEVARLAAENKALVMAKYQLQIEASNMCADRDRARAELEAALQTLGVMRDRASGMFRPAASDECTVCEQAAAVVAPAELAVEMPECSCGSAIESDSWEINDSTDAVSSSDVDQDTPCRNCVQLTAEIDVLALDKHKLKSLCGQVRSERDKAQHELTSALQTLERVRERECAPLNRECVTLRQELQMVTHERDELRKKAASCQTQVTRMKGQVSKLGRDVADATARIAQLDDHNMRAAQRWTDREVQWGAFLDHVDMCLTRHRRRVMALFRAVVLVARLGHERLKTKVADAEHARARVENERDGAALQLKAALILLRQGNDPDDEMLDDLQSCPELAAPATSLVTADADEENELPFSKTRPRVTAPSHELARSDSRTSANTCDSGAPSPALSNIHSRRDSATDLLRAPIPTLSTPSRLAPPIPARWRSSPAITTTCSTPTVRANCLDGGFAHMRSRAVDHGLFRALHLPAAAASPGCRGANGAAKKRHRGGRRRNVAARVLYVFTHGAVPETARVPAADDDAVTAGPTLDGGSARSYLVSETDNDESYLASDAGGLIAPTPSLYGDDLELVSMASPAAAVAPAWIGPTPSVSSDVFFDDDDADLLSQSATTAPPLLDADGEARYQRVVTRVTAERGQCFAGPDTGGRGRVAAGARGEPYVKDVGRLECVERDWR
ncbi:hypothetical protein AMAG_01431 [Allomyces macrogynus ATCC 38327]|uniref:Uncharacterized protein n=1 Tax=Allomyces macrogynus (strain ATCC 38327) TaxID=578462 RepID=A0A0L0RYT3_ALLM3|nr:hypothetical protein AMAG_01431 [Allomyces macrogynus ATCC 38327]|eukprot:KNE55542.1 hypothetical protein AMAG_01431 [Allomyces macrogynus ATCC 38327]